MVGRSAFSKLIPLLLAALALAACINVGAKGAAPAPESPEAELTLRARAMQRTVQQAAVAGATAGAGGAYLIGGKGAAPALGLIAGIPIGVTTGSYVGYLQQNYADNEARLERLRADIALTNAETAATIQTMRVVLDRRLRDLAAARAQAASPSTLAAEVAAAQASLADMRVAIEGAEQRQAEFSSTRALRLEIGEATGVDGQIAELGMRTAEMRQIAAMLAEEI